MNDLEVKKFLIEMKERCSVDTSGIEIPAFKKLLVALEYLLEKGKLKSGTSIEMKEHVVVLKKYINKDSYIINFCEIVDRISISHNL